jgi:hypothetical protein
MIRITGSGKASTLTIDNGVMPTEITFNCHNVEVTVGSGKYTLGECECSMRRKNAC